MQLVDVRRPGRDHPTCAPGATAVAHQASGVALSPPGVVAIAYYGSQTATGTGGNGYLRTDGKGLATHLGAPPAAD